MRQMLCRAAMAAPALFLALAGTTARADYVAETGAIQVIAPPASVQLGALTSDTVLSTFVEKQRFTLTSSVAVDDTAAGLINTPAALVPGTIAAGTQVDSYFFHSNPANPSQVYSGTVTFSTQVLGLIVLSSSLTATDAQLGNPSTTYPTDTGRGLELSATEDYFMLSADRKTLTFQFNTHNSVDEVRVVTAASAVPEPGSLALLGIGTVFLAGAARRRLGPSTVPA